MNEEVGNNEARWDLTWSKKAMNEEVGIYEARCQDSPYNIGMPQIVLMRLNSPHEV